MIKAGFLKIPLILTIIILVIAIPVAVYSVTSQIVRRQIEARRPKIYLFLWPSLIQNQAEPIPLEIRLNTNEQFNKEPVKKLDYSLLFSPIENVVSLNGSPLTSPGISSSLNREVKGIATVQTLTLKVKGPTDISLSASSLDFDVKTEGAKIK